MTLKDLYMGADIEVRGWGGAVARLGLKSNFHPPCLQFESSKTIVCTKCRGSGAKSDKDVKKCPACKGQGFTIVQAQMAPGFVTQMQQPCEKCGSKGKVVTSRCPTCGGDKIIHGTDELLVTVERGMADGQQIVFPRAGTNPIPWPSLLVLI